MARLWILNVALAGAALCFGCGRTNPPALATATAAGQTNTRAAVNFEDFLPKQAQPKLQTLKLWVGPEELVTELALNGGQQVAGMMFRTNIAENEAMLFVHPVPRMASYWMKNCVVPLSIAFLDPQGIIVEIHDLQPGDTNSVASVATNIQYALETSQGWFKRHQVRPGTVVRTELGTLPGTFFRPR